ncbi:VOC family protein [Actinomycetes bacterium KLBMP 9759]
MKTLMVAIRVTDLDRSLGFYAAIGYAELGRITTGDGGTLAVLELPDEPVAAFELVHRPADGPVQVGDGLDHLAIQVDTLAPTRERLAAAGLSAGTVEHPGGPHEPAVSWLTDLDGYRIELVEWPPGHAGGITAADFEPHPPSKPGWAVGKP